MSAGKIAAAALEHVAAGGKRGALPAELAALSKAQQRQVLRAAAETKNAVRSAKYGR